MTRRASLGLLLALSSAATAQVQDLIEPVGRVGPVRPGPFGGPPLGIPVRNQQAVLFGQPPPMGDAVPVVPGVMRPRAIRPAAPTPAGPAKVDRHGDPLPAGAVARFGTVRLRHGIEPAALVFTPDGRQLLSVSVTDEGLRVWDPKTGKELARLDLPVALAAPAADGQIVVSDGTWCKVWSPANKTLRDLAAGTLPENTNVLAVAPDSRTFAAGGPRKVAIIDIQSGKPTGELRTPNDLPPLRLVYSPDGRWLAGVGPNKSGVWLWDLKTQKRLRTYPAQADQPDFVFSPTGDRIAIASDAVRVYPTDSEELPDAFKPPDGPFASPQFGPDGTDLFAVRQDGKTVRIDATTGEEKETFDPPDDDVKAPVTLSAGGKFAAATDSTGGIRVWEPKTGKGPDAERLPSLAGPAFAADGKAVAVIDETGVVRTFDAATGAPGPTIDLKLERSSEMAFDARTGRVAVGVGAEPFEVQVYDVASGKPLAKLPAPGTALPTAAFSPADPDRVAVFTAGSVLVYSVATGRPVRTIDVGQPDNLPSGRFSPDGRLLAVATRPPSVWELSTGKKRFDIDAAGDPLGVAFSADGRLLAAWDSNDVVVVFDVRTGQAARRFPLPAQGASVSAAAFTPDGKRLVTGGREGLITLWDVASGEPVLNLDRHDGCVTGLAFTADGSRMVSTATDGTALVWDLTAKLRPREESTVASADEAVKLLGADDAAQAHRGAAYLYRNPDAAVKALGERIVVPPRTPAARIDKLIAELSHDDFQTRRAAVAGLVKVGGEAVGPVRAAYDKSSDPEVRKLAEEVLAKLDTPPEGPDDLRALRAVEVLENLARDHPARADARELLRTWAAGPPGHRLTAEAAAAVRRLDKKD